MTLIANEVARLGGVILLEYAAAARKVKESKNAADACLDRLVSTLSKREGVERAHVSCLDGNTPAALCIHFDAAKRHWRRHTPK